MTELVCNQNNKDDKTDFRFRHVPIADGDRFFVCEYGIYDVNHNVCVKALNRLGSYIERLDMSKAQSNESMIISPLPPEEEAGTEESRSSPNEEEPEEDNGNGSSDSDNNNDSDNGSPEDNPPNETPPVEEKPGPLHGTGGVLGIYFIALMYILNK